MIKHLQKTCTYMSKLCMHTCKFSCTKKKLGDEVEGYPTLDYMKRNLKLP